MLSREKNFPCRASGPSPDPSPRCPSSSPSTSPNRSALVFPSAKNGVAVEWMWGDGSFFSKLIPTNWSSTKDISATIRELKEFSNEKPTTPVLLKVPAGLFTKTRTCANARRAILNLERISRTYSRWSVDQTYVLSDTDMDLVDSRAPLLRQFSSVLAAVDTLNIDDSLCLEGICVVFSDSQQSYVILYRADMEQEAVSRFQLQRKLTWKSFARRDHGGDGYRLGDFVAGVVARTSSRGPLYMNDFDNRKWVMRQKGSLDQRYTVVGVLGEGVGGVASLLRRKHTGQEYVAKTAIEDRQEIVQECKVMETLRHPNCLKIVEFLTSETEGSMCTICEYARGGNLSSYVQVAEKDGGLAEWKIKGIFRQALTGVAYMHRRQCVHNDLKPENILVIQPYERQHMPRVVIADYGFARLREQKDRIFGDPRYCSPENLVAMMKELNGEVASAGSVRSALSHSLKFASYFSGDVWSMGVTLYGLFSKGLIPFLYERVSLGMIDDDLVARLIEAHERAGEVETIPYCNHVSSDALHVLGMFLKKAVDERLTAQGALKHSWLEEVLGNTRRLVKFSVRPDRASQILLNLVMWRLPFDHKEECFEMFKLLDNSRNGLISRERFAMAFPSDRLTADKIFDLADINLDDALEFNEFAVISFNWSSLDTATLETHIQEILFDLSSDGTGHVGGEELETFFDGAVPEGELQGLFLKRIDVEGSGHLSASSIQSFLQKSDLQGLTISCTLPIEL